MGGYVALGAHLYGDAGGLLDLDYSRAQPTRDVGPEKSTRWISHHRTEGRGLYSVEFDMVCEDSAGCSARVANPKIPMEVFELLRNEHLPRLDDDRVVRFLCRGHRGIPTVLEGLRWG
jgi:hypothetical protein